MKDFFKYISLFLAIALFGCAEDNLNRGNNDDETPGTDVRSTGIIDLLTSIDASVSAPDNLSRAGDEKEYNWRDLPKSKTTDDLEVIMYRSDGTVYNSWTSSKNFPKNGSFPTGTYSIVARHGDVKKEGFDSEANHKHPAFYDSVTVTVQEGKSSTATLNATVQNALIGIRLSDKFRKYLSDSKAEFDIAFTPASELTHSFAGDTAQTLYIAPGKVKGELIVKKGELSASVKINEFEAKKTTYHYFTIDKKETASDDDNGDLVISIDYADEFIEESFEHQLVFEDAPVPVIEVQGDKDQVFYEGNDNKTGKLIYTVAARGGMKEVKLLVTRNGSRNEIDLLSEKASGDIDCKGIVTGGIFGLVDVSSYLSSLVTGTIGANGENIVFQLVVTDRLEQKTESKELILTLLPEKSELIKPEEFKEPVGESFDLILKSTMDNLDTNPERLKLYTKDGYFIDSELHFEVKSKKLSLDSDFLYEYTLTILTPAYSMNFEVRGVSSTGKDCGSVTISRSVPSISLNIIDILTTGATAIIKPVNDLETELLRQFIKNNAVSFYVTTSKGTEIDANRQIITSNDINGEWILDISGLRPERSYVAHIEYMDGDKKITLETQFSTENLPEIETYLSENDVFAHYATMYIGPKNPEDKDKVIGLIEDNKLIIQLKDTNGSQVQMDFIPDVTTYDESLNKFEVVFNNLPDNSYYTAEVIYYEELKDLQTQSFTTEKAISLTNGNMESWSSSRNTSGAMSCDIWTCTGWETLNSYTTGYLNSATSYSALSSTLSDDSGHTDKAALIRSVGFDMSTAAAGSNNPKKYSQGELYLGKYENGSKYGIEFESRPMTLSFWYKYSPTNANDRGYAEISVYDLNGNMLSEQKLDLEKTDTYIQKQMSLYYNVHSEKGAVLKVIFKSTNAGDTYLNSNDIPKHTNILGILNDYFVGSELYIDDVELIYSLEKPVQ